MLKKVILFIILTSLALSGCNDPQEANKRNFTKAINKYLKDNPATISLRSIGLNGDFPQFKAYKSSSYKRNSDQISELEKVNIISTKDTVSVEELMFGRTQEMSGIKVEITKKGKEILRIKGGGFLKKSSLKIADVVVDEIANFTIPDDTPGSTSVVTVKYKPLLKNIEPWADEIQSLERFMEERRIILQLTNNGWVHPSEI